MESCPKSREKKLLKKIPSEFNKPDSSFNKTEVKRYSRKDFYASSPEDLQKQQAEIEEARKLSQAFLLLGDILVSKGMFDEALVKLATSIEIDKNQERAYALRGVIYIIQNKAATAISEFSNAIDIADDPAFYLNRGIAYLLTGDDKKSQKDFDSFIKFYPGGKPILYQRISEAQKKMQENANQPK